jgi:hypothetical protein
LVIIEAKGALLTSAVVMMMIEEEEGGEAAMMETKEVLFPRGVLMTRWLDDQRKKRNESRQEVVGLPENPCAVG